MYLPTSLSLYTIHTSLSLFIYNTYISLFTYIQLPSAHILNTHVSLLSLIYIQLPGLGFRLVSLLSLYIHTATRCPYTQYIHLSIHVQPTQNLHFVRARSLYSYLAASSASAYSMIAMLSAFGPMMPPGSASVSLTYLASERVVPGYGGGEGVLLCVWVCVSGLVVGLCVRLDTHTCDCVSASCLSLGLSVCASAGFSQ